MNGFDEIIKNLESESQKAIDYLTNLPEAQELKDKFVEIQNAIKNKDINKLMQISDVNNIKK